MFEVGSIAPSPPPPLPTKPGGSGADAKGAQDLIKQLRRVSSSMEFSHLNDKELCLVAGKLDPISTVRLSQASRRFNQLAQSEPTLRATIKNFKTGVMACNSLTAAVSKKQGWPRYYLMEFYKRTKYLTPEKKFQSILDIMRMIELEHPATAQANQIDAEILRSMAKDLTPAQKQSIKNQYHRIIKPDGTELNRNVAGWLTVFCQITGTFPIIALDGSNPIVTIPALVSELHPEFFVTTKH